VFLVLVWVWWWATTTLICSHMDIWGFGWRIVAFPGCS
jgi:hypothetical protein